MKLKKLAAVIAATLVLSACNEEAKPTDAGVLETQDQKLSYIFGQNIGGQFKSEGVQLDVTAFSSGLEDALTGAEPKLDQDAVIAVLDSFQQTQMAQREAELASQAEKNKAEGDAFLAENGQKAGVVTTESGLQYKVLAAGEGASPTEDSVVEVHYSGRLIDGTEFDSSIKRGVPATFGVTQVIPGWTEALQLMKEGAKWEIYIPSDLAYGPGGTGGPIGPSQTLIFEVELLKANVSQEAEEPAGE